MIKYELVEINSNFTALGPSLRYGDGTQGYCKRNLGYICTLINRCRALLQRFRHLVISKTAPLFVAQLIKCFGVWKVKVYIINIFSLCDTTKIIFLHSKFGNGDNLYRFIS